MIEIVSLLSAALLFASVPRGSQAASGDQYFYKGKTIRIIVGFTAGAAGLGLLSDPRGRRDLDAGLVNVVLQVNAKKAPDVPNVPNAIEHAKAQEAKQLIDSGIHSTSAILRAYALPPGIPKERLNVLHEAFMATMKDRDFVAEITKANLELNPLSGVEVENIARKLYQADSNLAAKFKEILVPKK